MAHPDLNQLLDSSLKFAQKMLGERGGFLPFGYAMDPAGKVAMYGAATGDEHPPSRELLNLLAGAFATKAKARELRAIAICSDVLVTLPGTSEKTDAISVGLEHLNGEAVTVFLPYRKKPAGQVEYGSLCALRRDRQFFAAPDAQA
jgi:hypothetical protein